MIMQGRIADPTADAGAGRGLPPPGGDGVWARMQRQVTERTENMSILNNSVEGLSNASANFAQDVTKFVDRTKRNMVLGAVKGKFGL